MRRGTFFVPKKKQDVFCRDSFMVSWKEYTLEDWHETYSHHPWKERKMIFWNKPPGNYVQNVNLQGCNQFFCGFATNWKCFSVDCNRTRTVSALHLSSWQCSTTMSMFHGCPHVPQKGQLCCKWGWFLERIWGHYHVVAILSEYANEIRLRYHEVSISIIDISCL